MNGIARRLTQTRVVLAVLSAAAATLVLTAPPALATGTHSGLDYVYGANPWTDDWNNEGDLSTSTNTSSNATCMWQKILWSDGYLAASGIDGVFGENTKAATKAWQRAFIGPNDGDGIVGEKTFAQAATYLYYESGTDAAGYSLTLSYDGVVSNLVIGRDEQGRYTFRDGDNSLRLAGYNYRTCS